VKTLAVVANVSSTPVNDRLLRALHREPVDCTPVWFMRQAGRSLPEYRALKEGRSLLDICRQPELCAEVTAQPVARLGVDAAVLYADIVLPMIGVGIDLDIKEGVGPVIAQPMRSSEDALRLRPLQPGDLDFVSEGIKCTLQRLANAVPLIGFAAAPFTLASYLIEGRPSRDFQKTKRLMYNAPDVWQDIMSRLVDITSGYLSLQVEAGVHALQLFDSWAGVLSPDDYSRYVQPYSTQVLDAPALRAVPIIHFGTGTAGLLEAMRDAGGSTIGVDWRVSLDAAWTRIGYDRGIQGNMDPLIAQAPWKVVKREASAILKRAAHRPGHIFNLGHGVHPDTDPEQLARLVDFVHDASSRDAS
jgi:uroporphyrinogen decarboxylase